jgi:hypothetical protein
MVSADFVAVAVAGVVGATTPVGGPCAVGGVISVVITVVWAGRDPDVGAVITEGWMTSSVGTPGAPDAERLFITFAAAWGHDNIYCHGAVPVQANFSGMR